MKFTKDQIASFLRDEGIAFVDNNKGEFLMNSLLDPPDNRRRCGISYDKGGVWNDFKAGVGGYFPKFVRLTKDIESDFEAKIFLFKNYVGSEDMKRFLNDHDEPHHEVPRKQMSDSFERLNESQQHERFTRYVLERKINLPTSINIMVDEKTDRIVFPIHENGMMIYWTARSIQKNNPIRWLNSPGERRGLVYNLDSIHAGQTVYIFEGIIDCLMVWPKGIALLGRSIDTTQIDKVLSKGPSRIVVVMDGDRDGLDSQEEIADIFTSVHNNVSVFDWFSVKEAGKDLNDIWPIDVEAHVVPWTNANKIKRKMNRKGMNEPAKTSNQVRFSGFRKGNS